MSHLLFIDNYDSFTYNIIQALKVLGVSLSVFQRDDLSLQNIEPHDFDGLVLSPGPGHPREMGIALDILRAAHGAIPILGICLGHQAIAYALGGKIGYAKEIVHGKPYWITHNQNGLFANLSSPFVVGRYHSLCIQNLPADFLSNAQCKDGTIMSIQHRHHPTYGLQFHPESVLTPIGMHLFSNFLRVCSSC